MIRKSLHLRNPYLAVMLFVSACRVGDGGSGASTLELTALEDALTTVNVERFGSADGTHVIGAVMAARITPDGNRIVVLDRDPPFLKVFGRDGRLEGQYIERGGGPREMPGVSTLAVDNQRAFLVGPNALMVATLDGASTVRTMPDFPLVDIGVDCEGRVVGYGPRGRPEPHFVHQFRIDSSLAVVSSSLQGQAPRRLASGFGRSSIVRASSGSVINHRVDGTIKPVFFSCDGVITEQVWSWASAEFPSSRPTDQEQERREGSVVQLSLDPGAPINLGAAELPSGSLLWLEHRLLPSNGAAAQPGTGRLDWLLVDAAGVRRGFTSQRYVLQDAAAGMLLLSTSDPWPQVLVLPARTVEELVSRGAWSARTEP